MTCKPTITELRTTERFNELAFKYGYQYEHPYIESPLTLINFELDLLELNTARGYDEKLVKNTRYAVVLELAKAVAECDGLPSSITSKLEALASDIRASNSCFSQTTHEKQS